MILLSYALTLGAIFREDQKDSHYDLAFKFAVHKINKDQHILPKTNLIYDIQYVKADDSFHANKQGDFFLLFSAMLLAKSMLSISENLFLFFFSRFLFFIYCSHRQFARNLKMDR